MALEGSLETFSLADVLRLVAKAGTNGCLTVRGDRGEGRLWVDSGAIVGSCASGLDGENSHAEVVLALLQSMTGTFEFAPGVPLSTGDTFCGGAGPRPIESALVEAEALAAVRWENEQVPSLNSWVRLAREISEDGVLIGPWVWRALIAVGHGATVATIAAHLGGNQFEVARAIRDLDLVGLVEIEAPLPQHDECPEEVHVPAEWTAAHEESLASSESMSESMSGSMSGSMSESMSESESESESESWTWQSGPVEEFDPMASVSAEASTAEVTWDSGPADVWSVAPWEELKHEEGEELSVPSLYQVLYGSEVLHRPSVEIDLPESLRFPRGFSDYDGGPDTPVLDSPDSAPVCAPAEWTPAKSMPAESMPAESMPEEWTPAESMQFQQPAWAGSPVEEAAFGTNTPFEPISFDRGYEPAGYAAPSSDPAGDQRHLGFEYAGERAAEGTFDTATRSVEESYAQGFDAPGFEADEMTVARQLAALSPAAARAVAAAAATRPGSEREQAVEEIPEMGSIDRSLLLKFLSSAKP